MTCIKEAHLDKLLKLSYQANSPIRWADTCPFNTLRKDDKISWGNDNLIRSQKYSALVQCYSLGALDHFT